MAKDKKQKLTDINVEAGHIAFELQAVCAQQDETKAQFASLNKRNADLSNRLKALAQKKLKLEKE